MFVETFPIKQALICDDDITLVVSLQIEVLLLTKHGHVRLKRIDGSDIIKCVYVVPF